MRKYSPDTEAEREEVQAREYKKMNISEVNWENGQTLLVLNKAAVYGRC